MPRVEPAHSLVQVEASPLTHLDLTIARGGFGVRPDLPHTGGTQAVGRVVSSERFDVGSRVLVRGHGIGTTRAGCWSEYAAVPDLALTAAAPRLSSALAAAFPQPAATAYAAVHDVADVQPGERVLVTGATGAVGQLAAQLALRAGAQVHGLVRSPARAGLLVPGVQPVIGTEEMGDRCIDVVIDTVGGDVLTEVMATSVRPTGRVVLVGYTAGVRIALNLPRWLLSEVELLPLNMMRRASRSAEVLPPLIDLLVAGELSFGIEELPFAQLADGLARLATGTVSGRAVVTFASKET